MLMFVIRFIVVVVPHSQETTNGLIII